MTQGACTLFRPLNLFSPLPCYVYDVGLLWSGLIENRELPCEAIVPDRE